MKAGKGRGGADLGHCPRGLAGVDEWMDSFQAALQLSVCVMGRGPPGTAELLPPAQSCQGVLGVIPCLELCAAPVLITSLLLLTFQREWELCHPGTSQGLQLSSSHLNFHFCKDLRGLCPCGNAVCRNIRIYMNIWISKADPSGEGFKWMEKMGGKPCQAEWQNTPSTGS